MKIVILASGKGTNAERVIEQKENGYLNNVEILALISDKQDSLALEKAKAKNIPSLFIDTDRKGAFFSDKGTENYLAIFKKLQPDLIVLAGFMKILPDLITKAYSNKIINLHPSLLPAFKGKNSIEEAFNYGVKVAGCTVHYVNEVLDGGKIIDQEAVYKSDSDTLETFEEKVHQAEYKLLPRVIKSLSDSR